MDVYINKTLNIITLIIVGVLMLLGVALFIFSITVSKEEPIALGLLVFASLFLTLAMAHTLKMKLPYDGAGMPTLTISKEGIFDRRIMKRAVPWDNLEWRYIVVKGNASICFNVLQNEFEFVKAQTALDTIPNLLAKWMGIPKFTISLACLKAKPLDIKHEIEKYKKPI